jgi:type VI secretion system protein ImpL
MSIARMSLNRGQALPPGVLTFPLEFRALKPALRSFVATLFEDNPYQFRPIFRGFYFTSAVQEGSASSRASETVAEQFALAPRAERTVAMVLAENGFFLKDLFSKVVFADRGLVRQFASRGKLRARAVTFALAVLVLALALGGWSWSYLGNRHLMADVGADLDKVVRLQRDRVDLASRLEALEVLQDRIEQLGAWSRSRPIAVSLGLYQGDAMEQKLRAEYFSGLREVMLQPVANTLEAFLGEVNANAARLQPMTRAPASAAPSITDQATGKAAEAPRNNQPARFSQASPESVDDAYNALKTYLMLSDKPRMEAGHLTDQITRFWRGWLEQNRGTMPNEQMIRSAERMISFAMANLQDPAFPVLAATSASSTRPARTCAGWRAARRPRARLCRGQGAAATRFAPMTVARIVGDLDREVVAGSYAVPGTFTREPGTAMSRRVQGSGDPRAADGRLGPEDLGVRRPDAAGQPRPDPQGADRALQDRIRARVAALHARHQRHRVRQLRQCRDADEPPRRSGELAGEEAGRHPLRPDLVGQPFAPQRASRPESARLHRVVQADDPAAGAVAGQRRSEDRRAGGRSPDGAGRPRVRGAVADHDDARQQPDAARRLPRHAVEAATRFNQVKAQGDAGPAARQMMAGTLEGSSSELGDALKFIDEQMLVGMTPTARATLRPLLVRPLMQSFAVLLAPAETEVNRIWAAQVFDPFQRTLAAKYPFDAASKVEATPQDIAKIFGPEGAVAKFSSDALGPLVVRRGDTITPRTWAEMGLRLRPEFSAGFANWVAPLEGAAGGHGGGSASATSAGSATGAAAASQTAFQILPLGSPGLKEYTVEIDGQVLRYRNGAAAWTPFVWPNPGASPGSKISAVTLEDRTVEIFNEPGRFSLERLFETAQKSKGADGVNELTWSRDGRSVTVQLRVVSAPGAGGAGTATGATGSRSPGTSAAAAPVVGLRGARLPALVAGVSRERRGSGRDAARRSPGGEPMSSSTAVALAYFGKIPSRGDFVRSTHHAAVTQTLDRWLTQGVELMSEDPRWKEVYDQAAPVRFAFLGVNSRAVLAGHLVASADASGRRFPFTVAGTFESGAANGSTSPLAFMARSPLVLARLWSRFDAIAKRAVAATEAAAVLAELNQMQLEVETSAQAHDPGFADFLEMQTLGPLEAMLRQAGHELSLRQTLLALGLLLEPVPASGSSTLEKGLCLPPPSDPLYLSARRDAVDRPGLALPHARRLRSGPVPAESAEPGAADARDRLLRRLAVDAAGRARSACRPLRLRRPEQGRLGRGPHPGGLRDQEAFQLP